ncbi:NADP-dependent oxidoreductase domain-containing protein [Boeremia exigua]|uniref:NADP-dependent oxidoreductase domain-containing protein n=1 Tax=Boeremia exigua TaxID=749465 RepID=UPI001E8D0322|nr:NADP-dependent oxidoreductase domain-containing protein [Boeremia exigua]KAH6639272.1 NADP-dependent oxidoreductase domain-containing protein [Boeremia exigua]
MSQDAVKLASGHQMPLVGFGLWKVPKDTAADTVYNAIKSGYRLFDGAYDYQNEKEAGEGIKRAISEGLVKREDIFITTKLWNNYHAKEHALPMIKAQNESWGLGYIDLLLIHFPSALEYVDPEKKRYPGWWLADGKTVKPAKVSNRETWESLETAVDQGIARSIGISNFQGQSLYDLFTYNRHPVSSLQIEHHPYLTQPGLVNLAQTHGIVVTAYSSFGPQSFLELPPAFRERTEGLPSLFDSEVIKKIASEHGKTPSQVLLRFATQRNIAVIPKSNNKDRLAQNLDVTGFDLSTENIESILALDKGLRFNDPGFYLKDYPLHIFT